MIAEHIKELSVTCKDPSDGQITLRPISVMQRCTHGHLPEVTIWENFKIEGQIGEKEQNDKLSYTNLLHQIDLGLQRGYLESEIVEAVVNAISPGLSISGMLEMKNGLTLIQLRRILKSYYKEEDAVDKSTDKYGTEQSGDSPELLIQSHRIERPPVVCLRRRRLR